MYQPSFPGYPSSPTPSAHVEGGNPRALDCAKEQVITAWNPGDTKSHLVGGFGYNAGRFRVPLPGRYYVYAQMYFCSKPTVNKNRVFVFANSRYLLMINKDMQGGVEETAYAGGVFYLQPGEEIYVKPSPYDVKMWMGPCHCYFGAYMISPQ